MEEGQRRRADLIGAPGAERVEEAPPPPEGHPLLATILACIVVLLAAAGSSTMTPPARGSEALAYLFGGVIARVAICWGVAWLVTIRRASMGWQVGSFLIVTAVAALTGLASLGASGVAAEKDEAAAAEQMKQTLRTGNVAAAAADAGPITRMSSQLMAAMKADAVGFKAEADAAGVGRILALSGLTHDSELLSRCDAVAAMAGKARAIGERLPAHLAEAHSVGLAGVHDGKITATQLAQFEEGFRTSDASWKRLWQLNARLSDDAAAMCRTLAHRRWTAQGARFTFSSQEDLAAFNAANGRAVSDSAELQRLQAEQAQQANHDLSAMGH